MPPYSINRLTALDLHLTNREQEVLLLVAEGLTTQEIGLRLGITEETVRTHISHLINKLNCTTRAQLPLRSFELDVIRPVPDKDEGPGR